MSYATLLSGPERRRKWPREVRRQILAEAFAAGAVVSEVARRYEVSTGLIYTWRRIAMARSAPTGFVEAKVSGGCEASAPTGAAVIVEFMGGVRVNIAPSASAALVTAVLGALRP
jgi:transposase